MKAIKLLCVGDSLTEAWNLPEAEGWTHLLSEKLNIEVINAGISGDTSAGMSARFPNLIKEHTPSLVIITAGTNDLIMQVPLPVILANIMGMIRYARKHAIPVLIGIPPPVVATDGAPELSFYLSKKGLGVQLKTYQRKLIEFAKVEADSFIDFTCDISSIHFLEDGVHLNPKGHIVMMKNAKKIIEKFNV